MIDIETLGIVRDNLPSKAHSLVVEWGSKHKTALMNDWELTKAIRQPKKVEPLK